MAYITKSWALVGKDDILNFLNNSNNDLQDGEINRYYG